MDKAQEGKPSRQHTLPPGMNLTNAGFGFDATTWMFSSGHIFDLTFKNINNDGEGIGSVLIGDVIYDVPDGMRVYVNLTGAYSDVVIFKGIKTVDSDSFSTSLDASLGGEGVSVSTSTSVETTSMVSTDDTQSTTVVSAFWNIYTLYRDQVGALTDAFTTALNALPTTYTPGDQSFVSFFQTWGTHYLANAHFGGNWVMNVEIDESVFNSLDTEKIKSSVSASFNEGVASGSTKATIESDTSTALNVDSKNTNITFHCLGGELNTEYNDWLKSVDANVALLNDATSVTTAAVTPSFSPIWTLAPSGSDAQRALKAALHAYLPPALDQEALPPPVGVELSDNLAAQGDGFLFGWIASVNIENSGGQIVASSDNTPNPTQIRATACCHYNEPEHIWSGSLLTPVRAGDYYNITWNPEWYVQETFAAFQPFPLGFGEWEEFPCNQIQSGRPQDGFVLGRLWNDWDGQRANLIGQQVVGGQMTNCAAASIHVWADGDVRINQESFCMPVVAGADFQVLFQVEDGWPGCQCFWIPIGAAYRMKPLLFLDPNRINTADDNGIVTAFMQAQVPDDPFLGSTEGSLGLGASQAADYSNPITRAQTAVQNTPFPGKFIPFNTAAAIVRQGETYNATFSQSGGAVNCTVSWVAIVPTGS